MIEKESDVNMENLEFIAEGKKVYVTFWLNILHIYFFILIFFSFDSDRILSFIPPFCDVNFGVFICLSD